MKILEIQFQSFRNLRDEKHSLEDGTYLFLGANGQGKTNLLEALAFLATLKSFRNAKPQELMKWEEKQFTIDAKIESEGVEKEIHLQWGPRGRVLKVNGNRVAKLTDYFRQIKAVCFAPEDLELFSGPPKERRRFMDRLVFQCHPQHLQFVQEYQKVLKQRNALLKRWQVTGSRPSEIDAWTEQMLHRAARLTESRLNFLEEVNRFLPEQYERVTGHLQEEDLLKGEIRLCRKEDQEKGILEDHRFENLLLEYQEKAKNSVQSERFRGSSLWGPHLEDFLLLYGEHNAAQFASTGQKKSLLLALRLAELEMVVETFGEPPVLLIDDISAELDSNRLRALVHFLAEGLGERRERPQIFVSTVATTLEYLRPLGLLHRYQVQKGELLRDQDGYSPASIEQSSISESKN